MRGLLGVADIELDVIGSLKRKEVGLFRRRSLGAAIVVSIGELSFSIRT
jgi:hypothetical protein